MPVSTQSPSSSSSIMEKLAVLLQQETSAQYALHTVSASSYTIRSEVNWRNRMCEWSYEIVDHFRLGRQVLAIAWNYIDRYMSISREERLSRIEYQLLGITSLYLAVKIHGEPHLDPEDERHQPHSQEDNKLPLDYFVQLSRGQFTSEDLVDMEGRILTALNWRINPPTPILFLSHMVELMQLPSSSSLSNSSSNDDEVQRSIFDMARYLTELAVCEHLTIASHRPSIIAYAALQCALQVEYANADASTPQQKEISLQLKHITQAIRSDAEDVHQVQAVYYKLCPSFLIGTETTAVASATPISSGPNSTEKEESSSMITNSTQEDCESLDPSSCHLREEESLKEDSESDTDSEDSTLSFSTAAAAAERPPGRFSFSSPVCVRTEIERDSTIEEKVGSKHHDYVNYASTHSNKRQRSTSTTTLLADGSGEKQRVEQ